MTRFCDGFFDAPDSDGRRDDFAARTALAPDPAGVVLSLFVSAGSGAESSLSLTFNAAISALRSFADTFFFFAGPAVLAMLFAASLSHAHV